MLLLPSPSIFAYYSGLMLRGPESYKAHIWPIAVTEFSIFGLVSLVAAIRNGAFMSKMAGLRIVADGVRVLIPMPGCLAGWIDDLGFSLIVCKTAFGLVPASVASRCE